MKPLEGLTGAGLLDLPPAMPGDVRCPAVGFFIPRSTCLKRYAGTESAALCDSYLCKHRPIRNCRICGCTERDCTGCVARTGHPCYWVEEDLCSACAEPSLPEGAVRTRSGRARIGTISYVICECRREWRRWDVRRGALCRAERQPPKAPPRAPRPPFVPPAWWPPLPEGATISRGGRVYVHRQQKVPCECRKHWKNRYAERCYPCLAALGGPRGYASRRRGLL